SWPYPALGITTGAQTLVAGAASQPLTVQLQQAGVAQTATTPVSVGFSSSSAGGAFATSADGPWTSTLSVAVPVGASSASVYYRDTAAGSPTVTASAVGWGPATQVETVQAGAPASLAVSPASATVALGSTATFTATGADAYQRGPPVRRHVDGHRRHALDRGRSVHRLHAGRRRHGDDHRLVVGPHRDRRGDGDGEAGARLVDLVLSQRLDAHGRDRVERRARDGRHPRPPGLVDRHDRGRRHRLLRDGDAQAPERGARLLQRDDHERGGERLRLGRDDPDQRELLLSRSSRAAGRSSRRLSQHRAPGPDDESG